MSLVEYLDQVKEVLVDQSYQEVKEALQAKVVELVHPIQDQVLHQVQAQALDLTIKDRMAKLHQDSQALTAKIGQIK